MIDARKLFLQRAVGLALERGGLSLEKIDNRRTNFGLKPEAVLAVQLAAIFDEVNARVEFSVPLPSQSAD